MERFTVAATTNGSLSQRPMFKATETSLPYNTSSFPPPKPQQHIDSSFSSYLRQSPSPTPTQEPTNQDRLTCRIVKGSEISIFEAEKYFNENQDQKVPDEKVSSVSLNIDRVIDRSDVPSLPRLSSVSSVDGYGRNYRTGSFHATPTASSEASWNSQSGLLSNPPGSIAVSMRNLRFDGEKRKGSSSSSSSSSNKWFFGRKCPCLGKKSVQVQEKFSGPKNPVLHRNSSGTASRKQSSDAGEGSFLSSEAPIYQKPKEMDNNLGVTDERAKPKTVSANNWVKEQETAVRDTGVFSPENKFPTEIGRRIVPSCRSFPDSNGGGAFSFPILNPPQVSTRLVLSCPTKQLSQLEEPPRESLEVFRPVDESTLRKSMDLPRRVSLSFPEGNDRRSFNFPTSPKTRTTMDDDVVSDASSDLFEIESFSTQTTMYPMYRRRDSLDEITSYDAKRMGAVGGGILNFRRSFDETTTTASIAPTEFYEPSEVSIDWSVTTAEGFDRASISNFSVAAASEYEENRYVNTDPRKNTTSNGNVNSASKQKGGTGLLSCRCEKAVNVGPNPVKFVPEQRHNGASHAGRINPAMSRMSDITSMHVTRASTGKIPLVRSNSARMPHALAT